MFPDYVAWMGTVCAYNQQTFDAFIEHMMAECLDQTCPRSGCSECQANTDLYGELHCNITALL